MDQYAFFRGDLVHLAGKVQSVGAVLRVAWQPDSDDEHWEYFDQYSDEEALTPLKDEHCEIMWLDTGKVSEVRHA